MTILCLLLFSVIFMISKLERKESSVKFQPVTMATGFSQQKIDEEDSFDVTRSTFLHAPGVPVSTEDELIRLKVRTFVLHSFLF